MGNDKAAGGGGKTPLAMMPEGILEGISGLEGAISEQTRWFKTWHEQVVCNHDTRNFSVEGVGDLPLGKWYRGEESQPFRDNPGYVLLGERLEQVAQKVRVFLNETADGGPHPVDEYAHFMNALMDLNVMVQQLQNDAWRGLTRMDPLTGVRNRHDMMSELNRERERARRTATACSVAMADLDFFKDLNDTHGHVVGDKVLRRVSELFAEHLRPYDMVYRYGGEEFLLCLPNTNPETAKKVLDRLRETIAETDMPVGAKGEVVRVTASFGVAEVDTAEAVSQSIERADMALYDVKHHGRNAVGIWLPHDALV